MVVRLSGSVLTCFHALLRYSICTIRLVTRMAAIGRKKMAIDSQEFLQYVVQKSLAVYSAGSLLRCSNRATTMIVGVKSAPTTISHEPRLRFFLSHSL